MSYLTYKFVSLHNMYTKCILMYSCLQLSPAYHCSNKKSESTCPDDKIELHKLFETDGGFVMLIRILCGMHEDGLTLQQAQHGKSAGR